MFRAAPPAGRSLALFLLVQPPSPAGVGWPPGRAANRLPTLELEAAYRWREHAARLVQPIQAGFGVAGRAGCLSRAMYPHRKAAMRFLPRKVSASALVMSRVWAHRQEIRARQLAVSPRWKVLARRQTVSPRCGILARQRMAMSRWGLSKARMASPPNWPALTARWTGRFHHPAVLSGLPGHGQWTEPQPAWAVLNPGERRPAWAWPGQPGPRLARLAVLHL